MKIDVDLPTILEYNDYHDFDRAIDTFRSISSKIKMKEFDYDHTRCIYVAVIYIGKLTDKKVKKLIDRTRKQIRNNEKHEEEDGL